MKVTIIIPLRITEHVYEAKERLCRIIDTVPEKYFNILIVDYGTPIEHVHILQVIKKNNVSVINAETSEKIFSIGHARDLGVQYANDKIVMFNDIDFYATREMYEKIYAEIISRDMINCAYDFFCVPVFFMSEEGTNKALQLMSESSVADNNISSILLENKNGYVEFPAFGSSAIVVNKYHYLSLGGHSRAFYGHGAEDYDILHRLSTYYQKGPRTKNYYINTKSNNIVNYEGFRAYFALYGIDVFMKGIFLLHLYHPKRIIPGYQQTNRNFAILDDLMHSFDKDKSQPHPLPDLSNDSKSLVLIDTKSATFKAIRQVFPLLGTSLFINENDFSDEESLMNYIDKNKVNRVLFLNPYGNEHRLKFYNSLRNNNVEMLVFDRGALPDSWFFDPNGFNFDSQSYHPKNWDVTLTDENIQRVKEYIFNLKNGSETLENNGARRSAEFLREKYNIGSKKVLFVPFQRPSDTVTNFFAGPANSVFEFQEWINFIYTSLPKHEWSIVCKNHPLEKELTRIDGVIYVDDETHVHDLIELSDKVCLMNSGVGLIALAFQKPVICCSDAFYAHNGLAVSAKSKSHLLSLVEENLTISENKTIKFYHHLLTKVYSFGNAKYKKSISNKGNNLNIVTEIRFSNLIINGENNSFGFPPKGVSLDAPLFYSFGGRERIKATLAAKSTPPHSPTKSNQQNKEISKSTPDTNGQDAKKNNTIINAHKKSILKRKFNKLIKNPKLFFKDAIVKIIQ